MRTTFRLLSLVACFALSLGCGSSTPSAKSASETASSAPGSTAKSAGASTSTVASAPHAGSIFFWHASKKGKPGSVWLLGSIHVRDNATATLDRAITDAATKCERGAFEVDFDTVDPSEMAGFLQQKGTLHGQTLRDVLSPETYSAWSRVVEAHHLPRELQEKFQPWTASILLQLGYLEQQGIRGDQGVDRMLYTFEKQEPTRKRSVVGLETALDQLTLLQTSSAPIQDLMLRAASLGIEKKEFEKLLAQYATGDEAGIELLLEKSRRDSPEIEPFMEAVLDRRSIAMAQKIRPMLDEPGCTVVTVGVGHMLGPVGIVHLLEQKGIAVERVAALGATEPSKMAFTVPAPKLFVSREDGFEVQTAITPLRQETDLPAVPGGKVRSYVFADRTTSAITISATDLPPGVPENKRAEMLSQMTGGGLRQMQLVVATPERTTVAGKPAIRARGDRGTGAISSGHSVALMHGNKLYMIVGAQMGAAGSKEADVEFERFLGTFRVR